ncbi:FRG domain-containing protein [Xylanimonas allomyrinae]|uniref:FRG domain-containing protein n=1 Tax=Xylanimonas allomyrinae TaxID=2509459 RepID=UPI0013A6041C|nr:FRG domain-containing protein [Xylanimonas allomyrinae]
MSIEEVRVKSISELVAEVLKIGASLGSERPLWHRGQSCSNHRLLASLARKVENPKALLSLEQRLITRFRQRSLPYWPAGYPQNDWEQLFAMQHHELPTRLLDWSENLFVALYFASSDGARDSETHEGVRCYPSMWILDPVGWNRQAKQLQEFPDVAILTTDSDDLKAYAPLSNETDLARRYAQPLAIYGAYNSARILAQRGSFTVTGNSLSSMEDFASEHSTSALWKFIVEIPRVQIQRDLSTLGFAESMIFPDLVGVSREIAALEGLS